MNFSSVLIIDDDPTQVAILSAYFKGQQTPKIVGAYNAAKGLALLQEADADFDLIVSDLQMPEMDGIEFMRHLNTAGYQGNLVIISGVKNDLLEHAGRLAKMHQLKLAGQLNKPISKASLDQVFLNKSAPVLQQAKQDRRVITHGDFSRALNDGDIYPVFQPKIEVASGRVIGAEVLARWRREDGTFISPVEFLEYARKCGRLEETTFHLFNTSLKSIQKFLAVAPEQKFATNLPPALVTNLSLPDMLVESIKKNNLSVENFSFEITEDSILNLTPSTLEVLSRLRVFDFDLAIDDFGTGSSNIQTLRDFPYSELKIDRAFISNATTNAFSRETVFAAVALAKEQGMRIVAEGVEDIESLNFIHECGIDQVQGFLIAKPLSEHDYLAFVNDHFHGVDYSTLALAC